MADVTGSASVRDREAETRYKSAEEVGVASFSSLFNVSPVVVTSDVLILDDVHGGEQQVAGMWTVTVHRANERLYIETFNVVGRAMTGAQLRSLWPEDSRHVHLATLWQHPDCVPELRAVLDASDDADVRFAWPLIRDHLQACLVLVSREAISIRPIIPPTSTHSPFADSRQRLYLSATLGSTADLQRIYGVGRVKTVRAEQAQSGRHFIFVPGAYIGDEEAHRLVAGVWDAMSPRRALLLAPSERAATATFNSINSFAKHRPARLTAKQVSDSLKPFTDATDVLLTLPGRYDGVDLPQDDCRLLIMAGSPGAISDFERHLSDQWKLGPVLRSRERTRLIQGLGRCTRGDTDYSIVFWLRQSLVDRSLAPAFLDALPVDVRAELVWGRVQSEGARDQTEFINLMLELLQDQALRGEAGRLVRDDAAKMAPPTLAGADELDAVVKDELKYATALWDGYFDRAIQSGQAVADAVTSPALAGYRGWWWYLTAVAHFQSGAVDRARDALARALACGVNTGFLSATLSRLPADGTAVTATSDASDFERIWDFFDSVGWAGPGFDNYIRRMQEAVGSDYATQFHIGVEMLGRLLGAESVRPTGPGVPDVVWCFSSGDAIAFEAKTEKGPEAQLSKSDILEANGHVDWVAGNLNAARERVVPAIVSYSNKVHEVGEVHVNKLRYVHPKQLRELAMEVAEALAEVRPLFRDADFADVHGQFAGELRARGVELRSIRASLVQEPLRP